MQETDTPGGDWTSLGSGFWEQTAGRHWRERVLTCSSDILAICVRAHDGTLLRAIRLSPVVMKMHDIVDRRGWWVRVLGGTLRGGAQKKALWRRTGVFGGRHARDFSNHTSATPGAARRLYDQLFEEKHGEEGIDVCKIGRAHV